MPSSHQGLGTTTLGLCSAGDRTRGFRKHTKQALRYNWIIALVPELTLKFLERYGTLQMSSGCLTKAGTKSFYEHVSPYLQRESPIPSLFHLLFFLHTEVESQTWACCTSAVPPTYSPSPSQFQLKICRSGSVRQLSRKKGLAAKPNDLSSIPREPTADIILWLPHVSQHVHIRNHRYMDKSTHTLQFGSEMSPAGSCFKCFIPSLQGSSEVCRTFRKWHLIGTVSSYFNVRLTHPRPARLSQVLPVWCHILLRYHP